MRIGIYKDTLANNRGADRAVRNLANALAGRGHDAVLFEKPELQARLLEHWDALISAGTNEILDLAAVGTPLPPVVQQFHTEPAYQFRHWIRRWRRNRAIRSALLKVAAIQVLRTEHAEWLFGNVHGLRDSTRVVPIGNWSEISPAMGEPRPREKLILCPGAINDDKNQQLLIRSFSKLLTAFPDWRLEIYGTGSASREARLRRMAERNRGSISLKGFCDLRESYERCAFVAFPSRTEGFSLTIVEAATFGKPVVMIRDWIGTAAAGGGIVTAPSASAYADGLRRLMCDPELCRRMGENARTFCSEHYTREKILDKWESLLESVVQRNAILVK